MTFRRSAVVGASLAPGTQVAAPRATRLTRAKVATDRHGFDTGSVAFWLTLSVSPPATHGTPQRVRRTHKVPPLEHTRWCCTLEVNCELPTVRFLHLSERDPTFPLDHLKKMDRITHWHV
jgi:hypothetical protein